jgi:hypothetical protein
MDSPARLPDVAAVGRAGIPAPFAPGAAGRRERFRRRAARPGPRAASTPSPRRALGRGHRLGARRPVRARWHAPPRPDRAGKVRLARATIADQRRAHRSAARRRRRAVGGTWGEAAGPLARRAPVGCRGSRPDASSSSSCARPTKTCSLSACSRARSASRRPRRRVAAGPTDATGTSLDRQQNRRPDFPAHLHRDYFVCLGIWVAERSFSDISTPPDLARRALHPMRALVRGRKGAVSEPGVRRLGC